MRTLWWSSWLFFVACVRPPPPTPAPLPIDRPDPTGDRALLLPVTPGDTEAEPRPEELPLQAFNCSRALTGKTTAGTLELGFEPVSPSDAALTLRFTGLDPECSLKIDAQLIDGGVRGGGAGAPTVRCRRSPFTPFAISCGTSLGSELRTVMRGNGWGRSVHFHWPWFVYPPKDACPQLQFVSYRDGTASSIVEAPLSFDLADCRLGPLGRPDSGAP